MPGVGPLKTDGIRAVAAAHERRVMRDRSQDDEVVDRNAVQHDGERRDQDRLVRTAGDAERLVLAAAEDRALGAEDVEGPVCVLGKFSLLDQRDHIDAIRGLAMGLSAPDLLLFSGRALPPPVKENASSSALRFAKENTMRASRKPRPSPAV